MLGAFALDQGLERHDVHPIGQPMRRSPGYTTLRRALSASLAGQLAAVDALHAEALRRPRRAA